MTEAGRKKLVALIARLEQIDRLVYDLREELVAMLPPEGATPAQARKPAQRKDANVPPPARSAGARALRGDPPPPEPDGEVRDEQPVVWPCSNPHDEDERAYKIQGGVKGESGMAVTVRTRGGKEWTMLLDQHLDDDRYGEIWSCRKRPEGGR